MPPMPPNTLEQAFALAVQHHQAGRLSEAEQLYRQILARQPQQPDALHLLGVIACQTARPEAAVDLIRQALALKPNFPDACNNLGNALRDQRQSNEAIAAYQQALALRPHFPEAHHNLAMVFKDLGRLDEAIAAERQAIALRPHYFSALNNLGSALRTKGQLDEAIAAYRQALAAKPQYPEALSNLGNALWEKGQLDEAITAYRQSLALKPNDPTTLSNLGNALRDQGQWDEAVALCRQAIALQPNLPEGQYNLGNALAARGQIDEAIAAYQQALALKPDFADAHVNLANLLRESAQMDDAIAAYRRAIALKPDNPVFHSNLLFSLYYQPAADPTSILRESQAWNARHAAPLRRFTHSNPREPHRRLRIGYVSPDLRNHVTARFLLPLFDHHDHAHFEIFCYSLSTIEDHITARLRQKSDAWRNLARLSDQAAAARIHEDHIDILIDLALHGNNSRPLIFARKPAPIQIAYLAYAGTTGLATMDYRLSDPYLDPVANDRLSVANNESPLPSDHWPLTTDHCYSEKTLRIPSYWCYQAPPEAPPPSALPAASNGRITFGCLNNFPKINDHVLAAWAALLTAVPNSRLHLFSPEGHHRQRLLHFFTAQNIPAENITFLPRTPAQEYFQSYHHIDIALDPFPYAGGTTTCDALYMGVPVISLRGQTAVSRAGLSILTNAGLPHLVAATPAQYIHLAATLARDLPQLTHLRTTLRTRMQSSPLMNANSFTTAIESAYRQAWHHWCKTESVVTPSRGQV